MPLPTEQKLTVRTQIGGEGEANQASPMPLENQIFKKEKVYKVSHFS
jgi:hypothetical protein